MRAILGIQIVLMMVIGTNAKCQSFSYPASVESGKKLVFPVQLWCKSKCFMDQGRFSIGADLTYYKNTLPLNLTGGQIIKQNYAAFPVYLAYNLNNSFFVESGLFAGLGLYRQMSMPVFTTSPEFDSRSISVEAGFTTSIGCRLSDLGNLRLRMSKSLTPSFLGNETWMPGRLELIFGFRLP